MNRHPNLNTIVNMDVVPISLSLRCIARFLLVLGLIFPPAWALAQTRPAALPNLRLSKEGTVNAIAVQPDGKIIVGGKFTSVNGVDRRNLARLNPDGSVDLGWETRIGYADFDFETVDALVIDGSHLYVGGYFFSVEYGTLSAESSGLTRLLINEGGRPDPNWQVSIARLRYLPSIRAMVVAAGSLYIAGEFHSVGGVPRTGLAKIRINSARPAVDRGWNVPVGIRAVQSLATDGHWLYAGGYFTRIGGVKRKSLARLALDGRGEVDLDWKPEVTSRYSSRLTGEVQAIAIDRDRIFIAGYFGNVDTKERPDFAKFNSTTGAVPVLDEAWVPPPSLVDYRARIAVDGDGLLIFGQLTAVPGEPRRFLARLDSASGELDPNWQAPLNGEVKCVSFRQGVFYAGGTFDRVGSISRLAFARLGRSTGGLDRDFAASVEQHGKILATARLGDGRIVFGGDFDLVNGLPRANLGRLTSKLTFDENWNPGIDGTVTALAAEAADLFVGGRFQTAGGVIRRGFAKFNADIGDQVDPTWSADLATVSGSSDVHDLALSADSVFVLGNFEEVGGVSRRDIAKIGRAGQGVVDPDWNPDVTNIGSLYIGGSLAIAGHELFAGCAFYERQRGERGLLKIGTEGQGIIDLEWRPSPSNSASAIRLFGPAEAFGGISDLAMCDGELIVAGDFTEIGGEARRGLAKLSTSDAGLANPTWNPRPVFAPPKYTYITQVSSVVCGDGFVFIQGVFDQVGEEIRSFGLAKVSATGTGLADPVWHPEARVRRGSERQPLMVLGDDLLVAGDSEMVYSGRRFAYLAATVNAPNLIQDPADANRIRLFPDVRDEIEVTHFQITSIAGGRLFKPDGTTEIEADDFATRTEAASGLIFVPDAGAAGSQSISAKASVSSTADGTGVEAATLTLDLDPNVPVFELSSDRYVVREGQTSVEVKVLDLNAKAGRVAYAISDASALAGVDYFVTASSGELVFTDGQVSQTLSIQIADDSSYNGDRVFRVTLRPVSATPTPRLGPALAAAAPNLGIVGLHNGAEVVIEDDDFIGGRTGSLLAVPLPGTAPIATGGISITLGPPTAQGQWRIEGDFQWRNSGDVMTNLERGNYDIEFRPLHGFDTPERIVGAAVVAGRVFDESVSYFEQQPTEFGDLRVVLKPGYLATESDPALRAQWRREGETDWHDSGEIIAGLSAGLYTIEFKTLAGFIAPAIAQVLVGGGQLNEPPAAYYRAALTPPGAAPAALTKEQTLTQRPYVFCGQIKTDRSFGSGTVVDSRTVLTAAHVLFDDEDLGYVTHVRWSLQKVAGEFEPAPLTPRGWYVFGGYAAQRVADRSTRGYDPGEASPESRHLDLAALYFYTDTPQPGRGGYSGFLFSDDDANEWIVSGREKLLAGYPMEGIAAGQRGRMHATPENLTPAFSRSSGRVYRTADLHGLPGMSGGPLIVRADNGEFYPAGVFLHSGTETFVRSIDRDVLGLINRAEASAISGGSSSTSGIVPLAPGLTLPRYVTAKLRVLITPPEAARVARWSIVGADGPQQSGESVVAEPKKYSVQFTRVPGFATPELSGVQLTNGQVTTVVGIYYPGHAIALEAADAAGGTVGISRERQSATFDFDVRDGRVATVLAQPKPDFAFDYWSDADSEEIVSSTARFTFIADRARRLVAHFKPGPFVNFKGTYSGLLERTDDADTNGDGSIQLVLAIRGRFTATLLLGGRRHLLKGSFAEDGTAQGVFGDRGNVMTYFLQLDLESGTNQLIGTVQDDSSEIATFNANLKGADVRDANDPMAGTYTLIFSHGPDARTPGGDGFATARVDANSNVRCVGTLGDGTKFATSATVSSLGVWPLFVPLYGGEGSASGVLTFDRTPVLTDVSGTVFWTKADRPSDRYYPREFAFSSTVEGATVESSNLPAGARVSIGGGGIVTPPAPFDVTFASNGSVEAAGNLRFSLKLAVEKGIFSGSFFDVSAGMKRVFSGAFLRKSQRGGGFFKGDAASGQTGFIEFTPLP